MSVRWIIPDNVEKIKSNTFQVYAQQRINIPTKSTKVLSTDVSLEMASGMIVVSVNNELKVKLHNFLSVGIILETGLTENIKLDLRNNSNTSVVIEPGDKICIIKYIK